MLRRLVDEDPRLIEAEDVLGTPLFYAVMSESVDAVRYLLDRGALVNRVNSVGWTPFALACDSGHVELVLMLLDRGADPSMRGTTGMTALMAASSGRRSRNSDHVAVMRLLIKGRLVPVDATDDGGCTALSRACSTGNVERVEVLLVEGSADHSIADNQGRTPMTMARLFGRRDCFRVIQVCTRLRLPSRSGYSD